jgi:Gram-negative bacterial TonB protein C-terminal
MKTAPFWSVMAACWLTLFLLAPPVAGQEKALWDQWTKQLEDLDRQMRGGQWDTAAPQARALADDMVNRSGGTMGYMRAYADQLDGARIGQGYLAEAIGLGRMGAYLALCEAAQGNQQVARWYWYGAQNLDSRWISADLAPYGSAGAFLAQHRIKPAAEQHPEVDVLDPIVPEGAKKARFEEPVRVKAVYPHRPKDLAGRDRFSEALFVQVTIEQDGTVTQPILVDGYEYPSLMYKVFEALSGWTFRPATFDGKPIPFRYVVPVVFVDDRPAQSSVFFEPAARQEGRK